jgi:hypothetical protein
MPPDPHVQSQYCISILPRATIFPSAYSPTFKSYFFIPLSRFFGIRKTATELRYLAGHLGIAVQPDMLVIVCRTSRCRRQGHPRERVTLSIQTNDEGGMTGQVLQIIEPEGPVFLFV